MDKLVSDTGTVRIVAIIPARMASSRFPGKPLLEVAGLPMIEHVRRRTIRCRRFAEVVVATCDTQVAEVVTGFENLGARLESAGLDLTPEGDRMFVTDNAADTIYVFTYDGDGDGIDEKVDNCPTVPNPASDCDGNPGTRVTLWYSPEVPQLNQQYTGLKKSEKGGLVKGRISTVSITLTGFGTGAKPKHELPK